MKINSALISICVALIGISSFTNAAMADQPSRYAQWTQGPSTDPSYFPLGVWLQATSTSRINAWKNAGMNLYIGTWAGPTSSQLNSLQTNNMQVICPQNSTGLAYKNTTLSDGRPLIIAWQQQDEPDNAQSDGQGGWGPPVPTATIISKYNSWKANDSTRPIWMNLSQGMGWASRTWPGQGGGVNPSVDYPNYIAGTDMICFDIYPMSCSRPETCDDAWRVAWGVDGLFQFAPANHIAWHFVETGDINANGQKATGEEIRMEVWSGIIHGSTGIAYFIHGLSSASDFDEDALLHPDNAENLAAVTAINAQVTSLAPVINSDPIANNQIVESVSLTNIGTPIDYMVKFYDGATYIFTASMRTGATTATFNLAGQYPSGTAIDVIGESRQLTITNNSFSDSYSGFKAHIYKINAQPSNIGVISRHIFYNNSAFDGNDPTPNANDDNAIASDKYAMLPTFTTTFANYTSYSKGINGIMIDVFNMPGTLSVSDFDFNMGNNSLPDGWGAAPAPLSVTTRVGDGVAGSDRVTIIWADNTIIRQWLKVTVKPTAATGLGGPDVFYFGNAIGDTGDQADNAIVDATDEVNCRINSRHFLNPATIDDPHDHNRDKRVDATDEIIARNNPTNFLTALRFIAP